MNAHVCTHAQSTSEAPQRHMHTRMGASHLLLWSPPTCQCRVCVSKPQGLRWACSALLHLEARLSKYHPKKTATAMALRHPQPSKCHLGPLPPL